MMKAKTFKLKPLTPGRKKLYRLNGGPLQGVSVWLCARGTLPMRIGEYWGVYNHDNCWIDFYKNEGRTP